MRVIHKWQTAGNLSYCGRVNAAGSPFWKDVTCKVCKVAHAGTDVLLDIQNTASTFLEYLAADKFSGENDWIRTWEVENILKEIRSKAQIAQE